MAVKEIKKYIKERLNEEGFYDIKCIIIKNIITEEATAITILYISICDKYIAYKMPGFSSDFTLKDWERIIDSIVKQLEDSMCQVNEVNEDAICEVVFKWMSNSK